MSAVHRILCVVTISLLGLGLYDYFTNFEENGCSMTYMFRMPNFIPVPGLEERTHDAFSRYSLYLYSEGSQSNSDFKLSGIPVLFIPGNAGSYKQVRSLGSVAITKAAKSDHHFDYFAVDLNGEKNALYGGFLLEQTEFVHHCIRHILTFYSDAEHKPSSVVVVGHSMGGVIARALFTLASFDHRLVHTIITQATPHSPVLRVDQLLDDFYWSINTYWKEHQDVLNHVTLLSVGGGHRDVLVKSAATGLDDNTVSPSRHFSSVTMSVPHVWLAADHQCIVWCKELVLATKRALFDMIDPSTRLISEDPDRRMKIFRYHFTDHSGSKVYQKMKEDTIDFTEKKNLTFKLVTDSKLHIATATKDKTSYYLFPIPSSNHGFVATTKSPSVRWVFLCTKGSEKTCEEGIDVTTRGRAMPPLKTGLREIHLSPGELKGHKFVVVRVASGTGAVINAEMYDHDEVHSVAKLPAFFSLQPKAIMNVTGKSYINLALEGLSTVSSAYVAELVSLHCSASVHAKINSTLRFSVPWKQEDTFSIAPAKGRNSLSLKLQSGRPPSASNESVPTLSAYVDPRCQYSLTLRYSHKEGYGQIVRFYGHTIPTMLSIIVVLATSFQLKHLYADKPLESLSKLHDLYCKPYIVVPPIALFRALVKNEALENSYDFRILSEQGIFFNFLPLVMFLLSYGLCAVLLWTMENKVSNGGRFWRWWKRGDISLEAFKSPKSTESSRLWPIAIVGGTMALAFGTCGAVAIIFASVVVGFKASGLKAKVLVAESKLPKEKPKVESSENSSKTAKESPKKPTEPERVHRLVKDSFHFTSNILGLINFLVLFTAPALIAWYENIKFDFRLRNDPSLYPALVASVALIDILGSPAPLPRKSKFVKPVSWILYFFTLLMVLYALESIYRCAYFLSASLLLLSFLQLL